MKANQAELPVRALCKTLRVSHTGYYDKLERPACAQARANAVLLQQIRQNACGQRCHLWRATHPSRAR